MRSEHLEVFLSIVDTGSISAAAAHLHMAQSNVSSILLALERETGQSLIKRTRGQRSALVPTEAGFLFVEYAQSVLNQFDRLLLQMDQLAKDVPYPIHIVTGQTLSVTLLTGILKGFSRSNLSLHVNVRVGPLSTVEDIRNSFEGDPCDFVVGTHPLNDERFVSEQFLSDPIVLICNRSLKLDGSVTAEQLKTLPLVLREATCDTMVTLREMLRQNGSSLEELSPVMTVYGASAVREAIKYGALCGFLPISTLRLHDDAHVKVVQVEGFQSSRAVHLIYRKNVHLRPEARLFRRFVLSKEWRSEFAL